MPIYLDHHATTPLDTEALAKMLRFFTEHFGNASSIDHRHGQEAGAAVEIAREKIAKIIGARKGNEIILTSGATEANNLAIIGTYERHKANGRHILTTPIEHPSVRDPIAYLVKQGAEVSYLKVDSSGLIDLEDFRSKLRKDTILVSVMHANNEIGTIQPISEIGKLLNGRETIFHVDAAQSLGHIALNVADCGVDLLSFSAHKFYGPKGVGGLYVRSFDKIVRLDPILRGGGHERGMRSGTINVPGLIGMAEALSISERRRESDEKAYREFRDNLIAAVKAVKPDAKVNGHPTQRLAHNISITLPGIEGKALVHHLNKQLSFSLGSACTTTKVTPSHVLKAINLSDDETFQTIRIGLGRGVLLPDVIEVLTDGISSFEKSRKPA